MSKDECKVLSEQIASRIDTETEELKKTNQVLMVELQQKDEDISKVEKIIMTLKSVSLKICVCHFFVARLTLSRLLPSWRV